MEEEINIDVLMPDNEDTEIEKNEHDTEDNQTKESPNQKHRFIRLPLSRIKTIMKVDPDCALVSQDSAFLVTKATEMFIEFLAKEAGKQLSSIKRKTLMRRDVDIAIQTRSNLCFLDGVID